MASGDDTTFLSFY